jgi:hypothetical protein
MAIDIRMFMDCIALNMHEKSTRYDSHYLDQIKITEIPICNALICLLREYPLCWKDNKAKWKQKSIVWIKTQETCLKPIKCGGTPWIMSVQNLVLNKVQTKFLIIKSKIFSPHQKILDRSIWMIPSSILWSFQMIQFHKVLNFTLLLS